MSRQFTSGFETATFGDEGWTFQSENQGFGATPNSPPVIQTSGARKSGLSNGGAYCAHFHTNAGQQTPEIEHILGPALTEGYFRINMKYNGTQTVGLPMLWLFDQSVSTTVPQIKVELNMQGNGQDQLSLLTGNGGAGTTLYSSTALQTIPQSAGTYTRIEVHVRFSPALVEVKVNDVLWITTGGNPISLNGGVHIDKMRIYGTVGTGAGGNNYDAFYDDIAVNDISGTTNTSWCGEGFIQPFVPNANGTVTQLINSAGTQVNNFSYVNTIPVTSNGTNSVGTGTSGQEDTYLLTHLPAEARGVNALNLFAYALKNTPSINNANLVLRIGGTDFAGSAIALPVGSMGTIQRTVEIDPSTGTVITPTNFNAYEAGIRFV